MKMVHLSHQGLVRINNEDKVASNEAEGWAILADGMGGLLAGEEASEIAVLGARDALRSDCSSEAALLQAHQRLVKHARKKNYSGKMGTTLVVWCWQQGTPDFAHVGDSRLYVYDDACLTRLSRDQTVAQRMVDEGVIPPHLAHTAPNQNVLTQALGMPGNLRPQSGPTPVRGRLLLCSDGLTDLVTDDEIAPMLGIADLDDCAKALVKAALDRGGRDNISVVLVDLNG